MTPGLDEALTELQRRLVVSAAGLARFDGVELPEATAVETLSAQLYSALFCRRPGRAPDGGRASGDGGFVAHLASSTRGATGWEPGFRLVRTGNRWAFASDGRLCLFLDEPGDFSPPEARVGERVMVRVPRARENLTPHRFTLYGGAGGAQTGEPFVKLFLPVTLEGAAPLVELLSSRAADRLAFSLYIVNEPRDFERVDTAMLDLGRPDEEAVTRLLVDFARVHRGAARVAAPLFARPVEAGVSRADALGKEDAGESFGRRRSRWLADEVWAGILAGERTAASWRARLTGLLAGRPA